MNATIEVSSNTPLLRFGPFEFDRDTGELRSSDKAIRLPPQQSTILGILASRPGRVVTRDEIRREIWSEDTHVDFDLALNLCVNKIRFALNDDARAPRYVETLPRRGYRFVASVEQEARKAEASVSPPAPSPLRRLRWPLVVAAALAVVAGALLSDQLPFARSRRARSVPIRSLAVLPFQNLTKDPAQDYFVDGIHDALITELARLGGARVISRTSVMLYRSTSKPAKQIARELDVDALVEGTVLRVGDRVRITAQLVRGDTDEHVWAASYDRDARDVLALLGDVSQAVVGEMRATVGGEAQSPSTSPAAAQAVQPEVYEAYLLAQHAARPLSRSGLETALSLYRKATTLDPRFAPAWGGLAFARVVQAFHGYVPAAEAVQEAREAVRRALSLDDHLASAHSVLGLVALYYDWDLETAGRTLERAVALNPSDSGVRQAYADYLMLSGKAEEGLRQGHLGRQYDPLWPTAHYLVLHHTICLRRYDQAIAEGRRMLEAFPETNIVHWPIGLALWLKGSHEEALAEWRARSGANEEMRAEWRTRFGAGDECLRRLEAGYRRGGSRTGLLAVAECTAARATRGEVNAFNPAAWYAAAGQRDQAFDWLDRSYSRREPDLVFVGVNPLFDPIRSDPRCAALLRRMRFPVRG